MVSNHPVNFTPHAGDASELSKPCQVLLRRFANMTKTTHTTLGEHIRESRQLSGLTQEALAKKVGVSRAAVSLWEQGHIEQLRMENLFAVADATDVNARWLALGTGTRVKWITLDVDEKALIDLYRAMPAVLKEHLMSITAALAASKQEPSRAVPFPLPVKIPVRTTKS